MGLMVVSKDRYALSPTRMAMPITYLSKILRDFKCYQANQTAPAPTTCPTFSNLHQSTAASTWWCGPWPRLGWIEMAVGLPGGPSYPGHSPLFFRYAAPLNDRKRAAHSSFKIGRLFSLFLFPSPSLALLRFLILLLLLISGNVHPNPGPIFPCSVCAGNVTWRGKSGQCCACSKWIHQRCSQFSFSNSELLAALTLGALPPFRITVTPSSDSSDMYTSTVQSSPASANAALSPHPRLQTSYLPSAHSISSTSALPPPFLAPGFPSAPPASTLPLTLSGFFNGMLEVFEPGALNYFTFSRPILSTLFASRNPILTPLPISGFLDSLLCALIAPSPGMAFSPPISRTLAAASLLSSGRAYSFSELSTSSLSSLDPYSD